MSVGIPGIEAGLFVLAVGDRLAVSAGAACHAGTVDISEVLLAMGVSEAYARGTLRLSVGRFTTPDEVDRAACVVAEAVANARQAHER